MSEQTHTPEFDEGTVEIIKNAMDALKTLEAAAEAGDLVEEQRSAIKESLNGFFKAVRESGFYIERIHGSEKK
ncbi:MAG: hypothetical protein Q7S12_00145 [bacterium]|nr:hypothetical protein [bacterium]